MRRVTSLSPAPPSSCASRSIRMDTSAKSRGGRLDVPAKITSSIPPPRSDLGLDSPMVQRIASSRFDLPQPLGPTTPVSPGSMRSSAGSTKLLKPPSLSRLILNAPRSPEGDQHYPPSAALIFDSTCCHGVEPASILTSSPLSRND